MSLVVKVIQLELTAVHAHKMWLLGQYSIGAQQVHFLLVTHCVWPNPDVHMAVNMGGWTLQQLKLMRENLWQWLWLPFQQNLIIRSAFVQHKTLHNMEQNIGSGTLHLRTLHLWMLHLRKLELWKLELLTSGHYTFGKFYLRNVTSSEVTPSDVSPSGHYNFAELHLPHSTI